MTTERLRDRSGTVVVRRYARGVYQAGAVSCLVVAAQAVIVPLTGAGPMWLLGAAPFLVAGGIVLAAKSMPFQHVTFGGHSR